VCVCVQMCVCAHAQLELSIPITPPTCHITETAVQQADAQVPQDVTN